MQSEHYHDLKHELPELLPNVMAAEGKWEAQYPFTGVNMGLSKSGVLRDLRDTQGYKEVGGIRNMGPKAPFSG